MAKRILNLCCGEDAYGDARVDIVKTKSTTHVCDLNNKFPFEDKEFDEVYCRSGLEHIGNLKQFIEESMRVLKHSGKFWFRTDNASYAGFILRNHQNYMKEEKWNENDKHYYLFKPEHLFNLFGNDIILNYNGANKKLWFLPSKFKCMHIEIEGEKK